MVLYFCVLIDITLFTYIITLQCCLWKGLKLGGGSWIRFDSVNLFYYVGSSNLQSQEKLSNFRRNDQTLLRKPMEDCEGIEKLGGTLYISIILLTLVMTVTFPRIAGHIRNICDNSFYRFIGTCIWSIGLFIYYLQLMEKSCSDQSVTCYVQYINFKPLLW